MLDKGWGGGEGGGRAVRRIGGKGGVDEGGTAGERAVRRPSAYAEVSNARFRGTWSRGTDDVDLLEVDLRGNAAQEGGYLE